VVRASMEDKERPPTPALDDSAPAPNTPTHTNDANPLQPEVFVAASVGFYAGLVGLVRAHNPALCLSYLPLDCVRAHTLTCCRRRSGGRCSSSTTRC
jgi:hypothetical protein